MASRTVIDGNAFYEIDEECMRKKHAEKKREEKQSVLNRADKKENVENKSLQGRQSD